MGVCECTVSGESEPVEEDPARRHPVRTFGDGVRPRVELLLRLGVELLGERTVLGGHWIKLRSSRFAPQEEVKR